MIPLPGQKATSEARLGFDSLTCISPQVAAAFLESGCHFCIRYISRSKYVPDECEGYGNVSHKEAVGILEAGLALMLVQKAKKDLVATKAEGKRIGEAAAWNATELGYHQGCSVWCDLEAVSSESSESDVLDYCNAWYDEVNAAGFKPGIYVGPNSRLSTNTLYSGLKFESYWKSASKVPNVNTRGYQMMQSLSDTVHGVSVDFDIAGVDSQGGRPVWLAPPSKGDLADLLRARRFED